MWATLICTVCFCHAGLCASHDEWRVKDHDKDGFHDWSRWERKLKKLFHDEMGEWGPYVSFDKMHEWLLHHIKSQVRSEAENVDKKFRSNAKYTSKLKEELEAEKARSSELRVQSQQWRQQCDEDIDSHRSQVKKLARKLEHRGEEKARLAWEARSERERAAAAEAELEALRLEEAASRRGHAAPESPAPQKTRYDPLAKFDTSAAVCRPTLVYALLVTVAVACALLMMLLAVPRLYYEGELRRIRFVLARISPGTAGTNAGSAAPPEADEIPKGVVQTGSLQQVEASAFVYSVSDKSTDFDITRTIEIRCPNVSTRDVSIFLKAGTCVVNIQRGALSFQQHFELASPDGVLDLVDEQASFDDGLLTLVFRARVLKNRVFRFPEHFRIGDSDDEQRASVLDDDLTPSMDREVGTAGAFPAPRDRDELVEEAKLAVPTGPEINTTVTPSVQTESEDRVAEEDSTRPFWVPIVSEETVFEAQHALPSEYDTDDACSPPSLVASEALATERMTASSAELDMVLSFTSPSRAESEAPSEEFEVLRCSSLQGTSPSIVSEDEPESPRSGCSGVEGFELVEARDSLPRS